MRQCFDGSAASQSSGSYCLRFHCTPCCWVSNWYIRFSRAHHRFRATDRPNADLGPVRRTYPTNEQQAASIGLGRPEAAGDGRQQGCRIGHRQYALEVERRIRHRRRRSLPGDTTLIVPVHSHVAGVNREPGPVSLTPEPRDALIADCGETLSCAQSRRAGSQRIHHDIVLDGTARQRHSAPNHRVGAQRESQTISRFEHRRERLRRRNFEQSVLILRLAHGENEEHAGIHLPPQEVATPIRIVGK